MEDGFRNAYLQFAWDSSMIFVLGSSNYCSSFILHLEEEPPMRVVISPIFCMPVYTGYVNQKNPRQSQGACAIHCHSWAGGCSKHLQAVGERSGRASCSKTLSQSKNNEESIWHRYIKHHDGSLFCSCGTISFCFQSSLVFQMWFIVLYYLQTFFFLVLNVTFQWGSLFWKVNGNYLQIL